MAGALGRVRRLAREHGLWVSALLSALVFVGLALYADVDKLQRAFAGFEPWALVALLGLSTAGYLVRFAKWEYYLRELDVAVDRRTSALAFFSGLMMVVTPGKAGEVWKAWFLREERATPVPTTTSVVGAERATDVLALSLLAAAGLLAFGGSSTVLVGVGAAFALGIGLLQWRDGCLWLLGRCESLPLLGRYAGELETFYESTYALFRPRPLVAATAISVVAWGLEALGLWVVLVGFDVPADPLAAAFVFGLGSVVGAVSLLPGGLLAAEASMVGLLLAFGYARPVAVGATVLLRLGTLWYAAALGLAVFGGYKLLGGRVATDPEST